MTTESALRQALQLIAAQDQGCGGNVTEAEAWRSAQAIARAALAAPPAAEPQAVTIDHLPGTTGDSLEDAMKWAAAQAAPSEPVAWLWELGKHRQLHFQGDNSELPDWKVSPLYTAPPAAPAVAAVMEGNAWRAALQGLCQGHSDTFATPELAADNVRRRLHKMGAAPAQPAPQPRKD
jgi:hypothetical protein